MRNKARIRPFMKYILDYWLSNPDLRFGQCLINLGIMPDELQIWNLEMNTYPLPHEIRRQTTFWNKYEGDVLLKGLGMPYPTYKQIAIKDLDLRHIKNILRTQVHIRCSLQLPLQGIPLHRSRRRYNGPC